MVMVLILMVPLAGLATVLVTQGARQLIEQGASRGRQMALLNAESGLDRGLAQLLDDPTNLDPIAVTYEGSENLRYVVEFSDLGMDGVDNDGDLAVDEADEDGLIRLTSRGSLNVLGYDADDQPVTENTRFYVKRLRAIGRSLSGLPSFPYAVYLGDPNAETQFNGNSFLIDGNDHDSDGNVVAGVPEMSG